MKKDDPESLIAGWLDGDLTAEEQTRLDEWLRENPENLDHLVEASIRDQQLREAVHVFENHKSTVKKSQSNRLADRRFISLIAFACVMVLGISAALWFSNGASSFAEVTAAENVRLTNRGDSLQAGARFPKGSISLMSGRLELQLDSGVHLEMTGPLEAELIDSMHLRLKSGRLNADVGERGKGFTVYTDAGDVIDLGTRFGIEADSDGECRVAVFTGQVEVRPRGQDEKTTPKTILLSEGQAARFSVLAGLRRWDQVALAAKAAGISSHDPKGVVTRVRDNLGDSELNPFYGIVENGMRDGALAYTDKPNPRWHAVEGETFPEWLEGADQIRTYHQFRSRLYFKLNLEIAEPAVIYVFQDSRAEAPAWLQETFTNTGTQLRVGPWNPAVADESGVIIKDDGPYLTAIVWKREVVPGVFELGPPREPDTEHLVTMYGLAVKPLGESD
ncbi:MAG: FecR domain-containing protein [Verrucomicrobiales bacterium]|nr:FecR domain-containing protein [Verrucomicrobiales bacterium]